MQASGYDGEISSSAVATQECGPLVEELIHKITEVCWLGHTWLVCHVLVSSILEVKFYI